MVLKKIDNRIKLLIESGVANQHRSLFIIVGDKARDQIPILHHILSKASVRARPSVLWCYKKELGFSTHRKRRMKGIQRKMKSGGNSELSDDDPFGQFVASTTVRYCYYSETHKILGNTFGMCVLQDFEAITPNLLARTIETVEGSGLVVLLLPSSTSLRQIYAMTMDVHSRFRTEAHQHVVPRFNERFILSLGSCAAALVMDDKFNILPISSKIANMHSLALAPKITENPGEEELKALKESLQDTQPVGSLINCCRTVDQARAVLQFIDAITEKTLRSTVTLTASRGRGKSAALGLAVASAVAHGYSNIFVTSPSPENLKTLFEFIVKGFTSLGYQEHTDYDVLQSTVQEFNKAVVRVNVYKNHRQTIQYISPTEGQKLGQAELVVIDEAAAIPLPLVKELMGSYLVFMASTINGYEGTGRALSLKLITQLRQQSVNASSTTSRRLRELELTEPIRYKAGDPVESWLNDLLCLNVSMDKNYISFAGGSPPPSECELYYVNRDTLFCYHKASEEFLQRVMSLFVASHYKNSPNDLQMLSDAPAHHIFCLLGPVDNSKTELPEIYCVIQVCLEGAISKTTVSSGFSHGQRAAGDLIPWTVAQQFQDNNFPSLSGVRVVRIAVHPNYQSMGYGTRALNLLETYYKGFIPATDESSEEAPGTLNQVTDQDLDLLQEKVKPRKDLPPLLFKLSERRAEKIDWMGTSFGLTSELLRFWKKSGYIPVYLRQTANELTGEHSCIMLKSDTAQWLKDFFVDFRRRFVNLLGYQLREYAPSLALNILQNYKGVPAETLGKPLRWNEVQLLLTKYDINRLDAYSRNMADYHLVTDLLPSLSRMLFLGQLGEFHLSPAQMAIVLGLGLQNKTVDQLARELGLPGTQLLGLYNKIIRKYVSHLNKLAEEKFDAELKRPESNSNGRGQMEPTKGTLDDELEEAAREYQEKAKVNKQAVKGMELDQYKIAAADMDLDNALSSTGKRKAADQAPGFDADSKFLAKKKKRLDKFKGKKGGRGKFNKKKSA